jgi:glycosyltransferase involved in cell wall biosynthesis
MPPTLIIDLRCLQDQRYIERGIQSHARSAIRLARQSLSQPVRVIGVMNPALDKLPEDVLAVMDEVRPNSYLPGMAGAVFLNPSPMEPDQSFIGRILVDPGIRKVAMVYDFIPFEEQMRYLAGQETRVDYFTAMAWLNRYDMFLPISEYTRDRLAALYRLGTRPAIVTGVPLAPWLETGSSGAGANRHVLVVAGDDARKNPELAIRAHAASAALQAAGLNLIITGRYGPERHAAFRGIAAAAGGNPDLVVMPGRVSEAVLAAQYREALCVVTPSKAEGFSMPVIEGMAAGVPSIASDIPVHAALVPDPALRFGTEDAPALTRLFDRLASDAAFRAGVVAAQARVWPPFRAVNVAAKLWSAVATQWALPRVAINGAKPKLAMLTPLPPAKSGVADYSAQLARCMNGRAELALFANAQAPGALPLSALPHMSAKFDRVISVMGNSSEHFEIYDLLMRHGGACICHDARLLSFSIAKFGLERAAAMASEETGRVVMPAELHVWQHDEALREADFFGPLAAAAAPLIFHTRHSAETVQQRFGVAAKHLPFALYRPWSAAAMTQGARLEARGRLGFARNDIVIASFGFIHATKGIDAALRAIALLNQQGLRCTLCWVGQLHQDIAMFTSLTARLGIAAQVRFIDQYLSEADYRDYLQAADFGLQLRIGSRGNISGALMDCIAAGLPGVASADIAENVEAPGFIKRVPDPPVPEDIAAALAGLINAGVTREASGQERFSYCERHSMENYARALCDILEV